MTTLEWILIVLVVLLLLILIPCIIAISAFGDAMDAFIPKFKQKKNNKCKRVSEQYILKSAIVKEVERLKDFYDRFNDNIQSVAKYNVLVDILLFIDTLDVKEVDLD